MLVQLLEMSHLGQQTRIGTGLPTTILKMLAETAHNAVIHQCQRNWGSDFAIPQPTPYSIGYRVVKTDGTMYTPSDWRTIDAITGVLERAGGDWWPGGLPGYVDAFFYNRLTFDWAPTEIIREEYGGRPWAFIPVDATTIRRAEPTPGELADYRWDSPEIAYVQRVTVDGIDEVVNEFTRDEMHVAVARVNPDIQRMMYGFSENEQFAGVTGALVNSITANAMGVVSGTHQNLLIAISSKMAPSEFTNTRNDIQSMVSGVRNNRRAVVVKMNPDNKDSIQTFPLGVANESMQYMEWIDFLVELLCGGYGMDARLVFSKQSRTDTPFDYNKLTPTERAMQSKERGFRPNLRKLGRALNEAIVSWWGPKYRVEFAGFDSQSERDKLEMDIKAVGAYLSPNELRAARNLSPFDDPISNRPLNALYQAYIQNQIEKGDAIVPLDVRDDNLSAWVNGRRLPSPTQAA